MPGHEAAGAVKFDYEIGHGRQDRLESRTLRQGFGMCPEQSGFRVTTCENRRDDLGDRADQIDLARQEPASGPNGIKADKPRKLPIAQDRNGEKRLDALGEQDFLLG